MAAAPGPVIGRAAERARVRRFIDAASSSGAALLVTGQPGVGKTTLLAEAAAAAADRGDAVLTAAGAEAEAGLGFAALHQLLTPRRDAFAALDPGRRVALEVALGLTDGPAPHAAAVSAAVSELLGLLARTGAWMLVLDDVQWFDRPSAAILSVVTGRVGDRSGVLAAMRSGSDGPLDVPGLPRLHLRPLPARESAALLARRAPHLRPADARRVLAAAAGNPLALLHLPLPDATGRTADDGWPATDLFLPRIEALPGATRRLLLLAALDTGDGRVAMRAHPGAAADALLAADLVTAGPGTVRFRHPLIRSTVAVAATPAERRHAHRTLGEAEPDPIRRAQHLADAAAGPDEAVAALLDRSADLQLGRGDGAGAIAALVRAAELTSSPRERARRLARAAYAGAEVLGDLRDAEGLLRSARIALPDRHGPLETATAAAHLLLNTDGDIDAAHRLLTDALSGPAVSAAAPAVVADALHTLLLTCFFGGRDETWGAFDAAVARGPAPLPAVLAVEATTLGAFGGASGGLDPLIAELAAEADPVRVVRVAMSATYPDRLGACRDALWRVASDDAQRSAAAPAIDAWILLALLAHAEGRWAEAERHAARGVELAEARGYRLLAWPGRYCLAMLAAARGDARTCTALADRMLTWAQPRAIGTVTAYAHHARAQEALGRGGFESAYRHLTAIHLPGRVPTRFAHAAWCALDLVEAAVRTGRHGEAAEQVAAMRAAGLAAISPRYGMIVLAAEALVSPSAPDRFDLALAVEGAGRWPFDLARVQLLHGEVLRRSHRMLRARERLAAARDGFLLLGATPWAARADSELRATRGRGGRDRHGTTARESEIAALAAAGHTNGQIAARLGISPRTVASHVGHVLTRLGLTTRAELQDALRHEEPAVVLPMQPSAARHETPGTRNGAATWPNQGGSRGSNPS